MDVDQDFLRKEQEKASGCVIIMPSTEWMLMRFIQSIISLKDILCKYWVSEKAFLLYIWTFIYEPHWAETIPYYGFPALPSATDKDTPRKQFRDSGI